MKRVVSTMFCVMLLWAASSSAAALDDAKAFFDHFVQLERSFDPAAADLYADDAVIKNKHIYPTGQVREHTMPDTTHKTLKRLAMPHAKLRGDTNSYSKISYANEGAMVRIRAMRLSNMKPDASPISLLVAPDEKGRWLIREEVTESRP